MKKELVEYAAAVEENLEASKGELMARERKIKAHYRLLKAKEALRDKELELLEDAERNR